MGFHSPARRLEGFNKPIRRFYMMQGYNRPVYRMMGDATGVPAAQPYDLNDWQVEDFFSRHPDTEALTQQFDAYVTANGYHAQTTSSNLNWLTSLLGIPAGADNVIPEYGVTVPDSVYGNVLIFPDANGVLHYSGGLSNQLSTQINAPPKVSPSGNPQSIADYLAAFNAALAAAGNAVSSAVPWVIGGIVIVGFLALRGKS